ncbi:HhH-GPD family protein [Methanocorpusculum labreanum Z]|uniref:HhH-GPD family protein n=1 Tax=Methanocorpusculum labreanum (strain ATCC 43576 / DSM 4855 / Z) TaxID=410358 RepID=A2SSI3_METLZ|nr:endonuclease III [Methanocorpusculum labreanum]ABN07289.1 HhH-GPD family protein [Methanocorpusculum labreanum Z]
MLVTDLRTRFREEGITPSLVADFQRHVMEFYAAKGRHDMEWRHTSDPYKIVVSEIMLQQTQVPRVAVIFPKFIERFPDFIALAKAEQTDVLAAWQGMGYNRRALNLQKLAGVIVNEYNGTVPEDPLVLKNLPGIGPATSCSIAAFAFNRPVVFIETNIRRVFIHYFFEDDQVVDDRELLPLVAAMLPEYSREWYWALMDLGTALKASVQNPNQRSRHYTKQKTFEGSDRKIRGNVLKKMLEQKNGDPEMFAKEMTEDPSRVRRIMDKMTAEGFFVREETGTYRLSDKKRREE